MVLCFLCCSRAYEYFMVFYKALHCRAAKLSVGVVERITA